MVCDNLAKFMLDEIERGGGGVNGIVGGNHVNLG